MPLVLVKMRKIDYVILANEMNAQLLQLNSDRDNCATHETLTANRAQYATIEKLAHTLAGKLSVDRFNFLANVFKGV